MTLKNVGRFQEDANETAITYKKFGRTVEDKYPSFSVCFEGNGLYTFNASAIFAAYGLHLRDYEMMMDGESAFQYEYDPSARMSRKILIPADFKPSIVFKDNDLFQLPAILQKISFVADNPSQSNFFENKYRISIEQAAGGSPFYVSYQSLKLFCLTRKERYTSNFVRKYDALTLDVSSFDSNTKLQIFVHHPGHLMRSIHNPRFDSLLTKATNVGVNLKVSQTTLLRNRKNRIDPCNKNIGYYDRFLLESVSNETACVPPYWRNIIGILSNLEECNSPEQLKKVHELTKDYKKIWEHHEAPCLDMFNSVVWNQEGYDDLKICRKCIYLKITYLDQYYEEIKEIRDFNFEDFISNLGGFIGIFLGYSMMQVPQLLGIP